VNFEFYINEGAHPRTRRNNVDPDLGSTFLPRLVSTFFLRVLGWFSTAWLRNVVVTLPRPHASLCGYSAIVFLVPQTSFTIDCPSLDFWG
jgi:hypothetical protein